MYLKIYPIPPSASTRALSWPLFPRLRTPAMASNRFPSSFPVSDSSHCSTFVSFGSSTQTGSSSPGLSLGPQELSLTSWLGQIPHSGAGDTTASPLQSPPPSRATRSRGCTQAAVRGDSAPRASFREARARPARRRFILCRHQ